MTMNINVVGLSSYARDVYNRFGVGKSCLCNRFMRPSADDYITNHRSRISFADFYGSAVYKNHFLYWGESTNHFMPKNIKFRVFEQTVFIDEFVAYPFESKSSYLQRCMTRSIHLAGKAVYHGPNSLDCEQSSKSQSATEKFNVDGILCCVDVNKFNDNIDDQLIFTTEILKYGIKTMIPVVVVTTKNDERDEDSSNKVKTLVSREQFKDKCILVESSSHLNVNVDTAFHALATHKKMLRKSKDRPMVVAFGPSDVRRKEVLKLARNDMNILVQNLLPRFKWTEGLEHAFKVISKYTAYGNFLHEYGYRQTKRVVEEGLLQELKQKYIEMFSKQYLPQLLRANVKTLQCLQNRTVEECIVALVKVADHTHYNQTFGCFPRLLEQLHFNDVLRQEGFQTEIALSLSAKQIFAKHVETLEQRDTQDKLKAEFLELLFERPYAFQNSHRSSSFEYEDILDICCYLKDDCRYRNLDDYEDLRTTILLNHVMFLEHPSIERCPFHHPLQGQCTSCVDCQVAALLPECLKQPAFPSCHTRCSGVVRLLVVMQCGDPFDIKIPLAPFLHRTSLQETSHIDLKNRTDTELIRNTFISRAVDTKNANEYEIKVTVTSSHKLDTSLNTSDIDACILVYSAERPASIVCIEQIVGSVDPSISMLVMAILKEENYSQKETSRLIRRGIHISECHNAMFIRMSDSPTSNDLDNVYENYLRLLTNENMRRTSRSCTSKLKTSLDVGAQMTRNRFKAPKPENVIHEESTDSETTCSYSEHPSSDRVNSWSSTDVSNFERLSLCTNTSSSTESVSTFENMSRCSSVGNLSLSLTSMSVIPEDAQSLLYVEPFKLALRTHNYSADSICQDEETHRKCLEPDTCVRNQIGTSTRLSEIEDELNVYQRNRSMENEMLTIRDCLTLETEAVLKEIHLQSQRVTETVENAAAKAGHHRKKTKITYRRVRQTESSILETAAKCNSTRDDVRSTYRRFKKSNRKAQIESEDTLQRIQKIVDDLHDQKRKRPSRIFKGFNCFRT
ncbi:uncharacterized protein LOC128219989 isoform X2 [Mya arenaria]|uniref:uncharacterized protein LOC128219989 isoform X2 n=1 Tax=Mya arenaria TaxID=6604 RepID=UPI0022E6E35E|nr:uncharacterized protein LOC128219989 isoform X2 [Mya arenaria]